MFVKYGAVSDTKFDELIRPYTLLKTTDEKIEYLYRLARVYEMTNKTEEALKLYNNVIDTKKTNLYFAVINLFFLNLS